MAHYKIIKSGHIIEVYRYEYFINREPKEKEDIEDKEDRIIDKEDNLRRSNQRSRENIRRLAVCNFDKESKFITITFKENITDLETANKQFKKFIRKLSNKQKDFKYLAVIEFQKRGAIHYHMLCNYQTDEKDSKLWSKSLSDLWGFGGVNLKTIDNVDNIGAYIVKYLKKDLETNRQKNKKMYLHSKKMIKPVIVTQEEIAIYIDSLEGLYPVYTSSYTGEYTGEVQYKEYNLKRS